jgi:hypothetical protein
MRSTQLALLALAGLLLLQLASGTYVLHASVHSNDHKLTVEAAAVWYGIKPSS